jgi:AbrB family looped-hinge helix DNA binding protein
METVSVSSKGQISIPKATRERLGIREGTRLKLREEGSRIVLEKDLGDWRSLRGLAAGVDLLAARRSEKDEELRRESLRP